MLNYIPTTQSPLQGGNLSGVLKGLSGQPWKTSNMLTSQPPSNNMFNQLNSAIMGGPSNTYGGFNYSNQFAPGLSGSDLAEAAQAGAQSGLTFDPSTGTMY